MSYTVTHTVIHTVILLLVLQKDFKGQPQFCQCAGVNVDLN